MDPQKLRCFRKSFSPLQQPLRAAHAHDSHRPSLAPGVRTLPVTVPVTAPVPAVTAVTGAAVPGASQRGAGATATGASEIGAGEAGHRWKTTQEGPGQTVQLPRYQGKYFSMNLACGANVIMYDSSSR